MVVGSPDVGDVVTVVVGAVVDVARVVGTARVVDGGAEVVVGAAVTAGQVRVARAESPQAKRLTARHDPSTSTALPTSG
jgi:hypothetical protein